MTKYQNILITGASSGIGEALALHYSSLGIKNLFICGRNKERLQNVSDKCKQYGVNVISQILDITNEKQTTEWIQQCNNIAPLHLVFANAGVATLQEISPNIRQTFTTNVFGVINTALPVIDLWKQAPKEQPKHLVLTASIAGYHGLPACPSYSASKACVKAWGEAIRIELAKKTSIKVSTLAPGFVRSRITDNNTCPMPFFIEADKAAALIAHRVEKNIGLIAFPWQMRFATWLLSILPNCISDWIYKFMPYKV